MMFQFILPNLLAIVCSVVVIAAFFLALFVSVRILQISKAVMHYSVSFLRTVPCRIDACIESNVELQPVRYVLGNMFGALTLGLILGSML